MFSHALILANQELLRISQLSSFDEKSIAWQDALLKCKTINVVTKFATMLNAQVTRESASTALRQPLDQRHPQLTRRALVWDKSIPQICGG